MNNGISSNPALGFSVNPMADPEAAARMPFDKLYVLFCGYLATQAQDRVKEAESGLDERLQKVEKLNKLLGNMSRLVEGANDQSLQDRAVKDPEILKLMGEINQTAQELGLELLPGQVGYTGPGPKSSAAYHDNQTRIYSLDETADYLFAAPANGGMTVVTQPAQVIPYSSEEQAYYRADQTQGAWVSSGADGTSFEVHIPEVTTTVMNPADQARLDLIKSDLGLPASTTWADLTDGHKQEWINKHWALKVDSLDGPRLRSVAEAFSARGATAVTGYVNDDPLGIIIPSGLSASQKAAMESLEDTLNLKFVESYTSYYLPAAGTQGPDRVEGGLTMFDTAKELQAALTVVRGRIEDENKQLNKSMNDMQNKTQEYQGYLSRLSDLLKTLKSLAESSLRF